MKKFKVLIEGINCFIKFENEIKKVGFFTTRFIESENRETAEINVLHSIKNELCDIILNERLNPPGLSIEEITEIEVFDTHDSGLGFTWYLEDEQ